MTHSFELIEEDTIDIESIEEIEYYEVNGVGEEQDIFILKETGEYLCEAYNGFEMVVIRKINELVQAVKQLNKEIKELNKNYCCNCGVELTEENKALEDICNECKYGEE